MKNNISSFSILVFVILLHACSTKKSISSEHISSTTKNPYLNIKPPGMRPEKFPADPEDWVLARVNAGMKEMYFTSASAGYAPHTRPVVCLSKNESKYNTWNKYAFYPASGGEDKVRYCKNKYIERTETGWSEIKSLGVMFEREDWGIMRLVASNKGTIVFDDYKNNDVLRVSTMKDGKREAPILLHKGINTGKFTCHPFIGADDAYIIFDSERAGGYGETDLYITFRQPDGSWGAAINMGSNINTAGVEGSATVTSDGKYLLFGRDTQKVRADGSTYWEGSRYWVDAKVIEQLKAQQ